MVRNPSVLECRRNVSASLDGSALRHRLFVYGSLKTGFTNFERYLGVSVARGGAELIGIGVTQQSFPMVIRPRRFSPTLAPVLMDKPNVGHNIRGEVFQVDHSTLAALDILEGVAVGKYYKDSIQVEVQSPRCSRTLTCTCYFSLAKAELLSQEYIPEYLAEHHALYNPSAVKEDIAALCRGTLSTPREKEVVTPSEHRSADADEEAETRLREL